MLESRSRATRVIVLALFVAAVTTLSVTAQSKPYPVEYYYKAKWGHFNEFLELYKKNHYPVMAKLQELGRIVEMRASYPRYHGGEDSRWDFRIVLVWKDAATATDDFDESAIIKALYPDQERFLKEEQRRFQILEEHMDVPVVDYDLSEWKTTPP